MGTHDRPTSSHDQMAVSRLTTIATRRWEPPTGPERDAVLAELGAVADGRMDLVVQAAGVLLGYRAPDEHDPRHAQATDGAAMLLELAGVEEADAEVQRWVAVGRERRARNWLRRTDE